MHDKLKTIIGKLMTHAEQDSRLSKIADEKLIFDEVGEKYILDVINSDSKFKVKKFDHDNFSKFEFGNYFTKPFKFVGIILATYIVMKNGIPQKWQELLMNEGLTEMEADILVKKFMTDLTKLVDLQ